MFQLVAIVLNLQFFLQLQKKLATFAMYKKGIAAAPASTAHNLNLYYYGKSFKESKRLHRFTK